MCGRLRCQATEPTSPPRKTGVTTKAFPLNCLPSQTILLVHQPMVLPAEGCPTETLRTSCWRKQSPSVAIVSTATLRLKSVLPERRKQLLAPRPVRNARAASGTLTYRLRHPRTARLHDVQWDSEACDTSQPPDKAGACKTDRPHMADIPAHVP